jgi:hypothetical protein
MTDVVQDILAVEKQKACEMMITCRYGKRTLTFVLVVWLVLLARARLLVTVAGDCAA